jgi:hypothetical protein
MAAISTGDLVSRFNKVMDSTDEGIRDIFMPSKRSAELGHDDMALVRHVSVLSFDEFQLEVDSLQSNRFSLNRRLEGSINHSEKSVIPSVESAEDIIDGDVNRVRQVIDSWTLQAPLVQTLHSLRDEKSALKSLLDRLQSFQDFMDTPYLIRDCIARHQLSDAWTLLEFGKKTIRKQNVESIPIFATLVAELNDCRSVLLSNIEATLSRKPLRVPETNNLLLIYRMMFPQADLQEKFVEWRSNFYTTRKSEIRKGHSISKIVKDSTELLRVHLSDMVNQYRAIFSGGKQTEKVQDLTYSLTRFVVQEVDYFFDLIESSVHKISQENAFQLLLDVYCTATHIRICDLNPKLNEISYRYTAARIKMSCEEAVAGFRHELGVHNWRPFNSLIPDTVSDENRIIQLTRNRPLAVLYNDLTALLNDIRLFPLAAVDQPLVFGVDGVIHSCFDMLSSFASAPSGELSIATKNLCCILVPAIETHLANIFIRSIRLERTRNDTRFIRDLVEPAPPAINQAGSLNAPTRMDSQVNVPVEKLLLPVSPREAKAQVPET